MISSDRLNDINSKITFCDKCIFIESIEGAVDCYRCKITEKSLNWHSRGCYMYTEKRDNI